MNLPVPSWKKLWWSCLTHHRRQHHVYGPVEVSIIDVFVDTGSG